MKGFARSCDFWSGLVLAALGAYIVSQAWRWDYMTEEGPGPGFFPLWYGSLMVILSLALAAGAVLKRPAGAGKPVQWNDLGRAMLCWIAFVASIALMPIAGFPVCFALLTWFIVAVMARRPQKIALPLSIGGAVFFYVLFEVALDLQLPHGLLF